MVYTRRLIGRAAVSYTRDMKLYCLALLALVACSSTPTKEDPFAKSKGCFLLYNVKTDRFEKTLGDISCKERLPACSTFKVPLAVMAFDSKVLKDESVVLKWDGKVDERQALNRDHDAKSWMSDSVVWFSQRITTQLGKKKLQKYLSSFHYGNQDLSAGITEAWLVSPSAKNGLRINAYEQVEFMKKLWKDKLPATKRAQALAREITFLEKSPKGFLLHGKTGSNFYDPERKVRLGWFVSHLASSDGKEYIAVTNFSDLAPSEDSGYGGLKAKEMTKTILAAEGLW